MPAYPSTRPGGDLSMGHIPWFTWLLALLAVMFVVLTLLGFLISSGITE
jgi:hypothetical protein